MQDTIFRFFISVLTIVGLACPAHSVEDTFIPDATKMSWAFDERKASLMLSVMLAPSEYGYRIAVRPNDKAMTLTITDADGMKLVSETVNDHTAFTIFEKKLVFAEYSDVGTGCTIVAVDLPDGKEAWRTRLMGVDFHPTQSYSNLVVLATRGKYLSVYGNESMGKYIKIVDMQTGKELSTKSFPQGTTSTVPTPLQPVHE